ncbi:hypothetical protein BDZ91DRAFT_676670 [Kalaharituber pfeilii]|nr:hypothetical protein BDZ91DRAFT_676670 [Kalaharituber pfeilii]
MLHPAVIRKINFFYPIGNTPAVLLTQSLEPEQPVNALLLGCGDPRSILYTVYSNTSNLPADISLQYDFTCCDLQSAVLARNVLLFTLIADDEDGERNLLLWNIFYHFYLDQASLALLQEQAKKLAAFSESLEAWHASKYGTFLRMCNRETLLELRRLWRLYAQPLTEQAEKLFKRGIKTLMKRHEGFQAYPINWSNSSALAGGPLYAEAVKVLRGQGFRFWKTGTTSYKRSEVYPAIYSNPTFLYSADGEEVMVHYGTNPLESFHLADALADRPRRAMTGKAVNPPQPATNALDHVIDTCRSQFKSWCIGFKHALDQKCCGVQSHGIRLRFFAGDAMAFCCALRLQFESSKTYQHAQRKSPCFYTKPWSFSVLHLDGCDYNEGAAYSAPLRFNVIDTSNLADHIGPLNVLLCSHPLLEKSPSAALFTESLHQVDRDNVSELENRLGADLGTISLLFDLVPLQYILPVSSVTSSHELGALKNIIKSNLDMGSSDIRGHQRLGWKRPQSGDNLLTSSYGNTPLTVQKPEELANWLYRVYLTLFARENYMATMATLRNSSRDPEKAVRHLSSHGLIHYTRETYAYVLKLVRDRVSVDWDRMTKRLVNLIEYDRTLLAGLNFYQDLRTQWHLLNLVRIPLLTPTMFNKIPGWRSSPQVVCVTLVVPRTALRVFDQVDRTKLGTPCLQGQVASASQTWVNEFLSIKAAFGSIRAEGKSDNLSITVEEDRSGWDGKSDMVVAWYVPGWILRTEPENTLVSLELATSFQSTETFISLLGPELAVFKAKLLDEAHVRISKNLPGLQQRDWSQGCTESTTVEEGPRLPGGTTLSLPSLIWSKNYESLEKISVTARGAKLGTLLEIGEVINQKPSSPCSLSISVGDHYDFTVPFPFPVNGSRSTLRIARKSGYIEVIAPIYNHSQQCGFLAPVKASDVVALTRNLHRANLTTLPAVDIDTSANRTWLASHLNSAVGFSNAVNIDDTVQETSIYRSIHSVIATCAGLRSTLRPRTVYVHSSSDLMHGILLLVLDLRLDFSSHSVALDTCAVTNDTAFELAFACIMNRPERYRQLVCTEEVMKAWRVFIRAFVGRCRTWRHRSASCEYLPGEKVPLPQDPCIDSLCPCGLGTIPNNLLQANLKKWGLNMEGASTALKENGVRAALCPLFAGPFAKREVHEDALFSSQGVLEDSSLDTGTKAGFHDNVAKKHRPGTDEIKSIEESVCDNCFTSAADGKALLKCGRCKMVMYCSKKCQKEDWPLHRVSCALSVENGAGKGRA